MIENLLPKYLFKKKSSISSHIPQGALFLPTEAIDNCQGFKTLYSPSEELQKKQIYFDYQAIFRLWDKNERALIIAKLKEEGFEVFFIFTKNQRSVLAEIDRDLKVEIGDRKKSIFLLEDQDLEKLSQIDHDKVITKLGLAIDDSIILKYEQFKEIADILRVNSWVQKGAFKSHLRLSDVDFLNGFEGEDNYFIKKYLHQQELDDVNLEQMMINYFQLPDFDAEDKNIKNLLEIFLKYFKRDKEFIISTKTEPEIINTKLSATAKILVNAIKPIYQDNPENVKKIFDFLFNYQFSDSEREDKIIFQKFIVEYFWFYHPDFSELVAKAQTISGFEQLSQDQIAKNLLEYKISKTTKFDKHIDLERLSDPLRNKIIENYIAYYSEIQQQATLGEIDICDYLMILRRYGVKLEFSNKGDDDIILLIDDQEQVFNLKLIIQLLNNKELKDQFRIEDLLSIYFEIFNKFDINQNFGSYHCDELIEVISDNFDYLPTDLQKQSIDKFNNLIDSIYGHKSRAILVLNAISKKITNPKILKEISCKLTQKKSGIDYSDGVISALLIEILQHGVENQEVKDFLEIILIKKQESRISISKPTPKFEDFLITLHGEGKIDLVEFSIDKKSKISEKFWRELLHEQVKIAQSGHEISILPEIYLANFSKAYKSNFKTELSEVSSKQLNQSPIQFYVVDLNQNSIDRIKDLIAKDRLNSSKIISLNILGFNRKNEELPEDSAIIDKKQLLTKVIELFPNLKHLRVNQEYFEKSDIDESIESRNLATEFFDYGNSEISRALDKAQAGGSNQSLQIQTPPQPQQNSSEDRLLIANQAGKSEASKSMGNDSFDMVDAGKIIHRPEGKLFDLMMRNSSCKLELTKTLLSDDWLPEDNDQSFSISAPKILSKEDFKKFSPEESEKQTHSFCSFTLELKAHKKSKLLSISPDNEIVGYFTNPQVDDIKFYKDEAGFFYVECSRSCTINYILKGQELDRKTPKDELADIPDLVLEIIESYAGDDKQNFPLLITESQYSLPYYNFDSNSTITRQNYNKEWLYRLFEIENKGSCRHRVMALANKFIEKGLRYYQDFRIIGVNNNHILFEVKTNDNVWITLDLGGSRSQLNYQAGEKYQAPIALSDQKTPDKDTSNSDSPSSSPEISQQSSRPYQAPIALSDQKTPDKDTSNSDSPSSSPEISQQSPRLLDSNLPIPNQAQEDPEFKILEEEISKLYQLRNSKNLDEFQQSLTSFIQNSENKSLLLTTKYFQELKNYLLFLNRTSIIGETSVGGIAHGEISDKDSDLSFHIITSPQDLAINKDSIKITDSNPEIASQTPLADFFAQAKLQNLKTHLLIIDWSKFDDKHRVASNTMFDNQSMRTIDGVEIPDNVKIICIDEVKSQSVDPAVLSRFNQALDLSTIFKTNLLSIVNQDEDQLLDSQAEGIEKLIEFDGEGMDNWQQKLFGRIIVNGEDLEWQKSNFVEELESLLAQSFVDQSLIDQSLAGQRNKIEFQFKNFSKKQQDQILELFNQARIQGFINYFGYQIKIPRNFSIKFDQVEFDFKGILKSFSTGKDIALESPFPLASSSSNPQQITLKIHKNIQSLEAIDHKDNLKIINSQLFDQLLVKKLIEGSSYQENQGLIEEHKNKTLKLFITEQLTPAQFYCLIFNAQKHQVSLELYFAKNVKIDDRDFFGFYQSPIAEIAGDQVALSLQASQASPESKLSRIIISNDVEKAFNELKQKLTTSNDSSANSINVVNIEDVLFSDLFDDVKYQIKMRDGKKHFIFEKLASEVVTKLSSGEVVVLKGKFPCDLLSSLHEQILDFKARYPKLYFIIEEDILQSSKESSQLTWLDPKSYSIEYHRKEKIQEIPIEREDPACVKDRIPADSQQQAQDFITKRKAKLKELLDGNCALQILGHSGVGKSSLFREIKKTGLERMEDVSVFEELENLEKWANDKSDKTKILVIDEFNVDGSTNFTMFRDFVNARVDLANQSARRIFYKGKFYQLSNKHKVVFLGNPHNYGNRYKHKLFLDCQIQELKLMDFSLSYIYENILKEPIFDKLSQEIKRQLSEEKFKEITVEAIRKYYENNQKKSDDQSDLPQETVRELQERVLQEIVKKTQKNIRQEVANDNFISTPANQETIKKLQIAIQIRQLQKQRHFPPECLGTNGVIFEGDSGIGKSVMIEAILQNQGITKITNLDSLKHANSLIARQANSLDSQSSDQESHSQHSYYKIDASLSYQEIKEKLLLAFELGVIVVIDELNTRINEGLEKDINALLTGQHPTDSSIKMNAGFMIITSVNKASSAGRANFSPAIKHRCSNISGPSLSNYQVEDFTRIMVNWCEKNPALNQENLNLKVIKKIAENFKKLVAKNPKVNLRVLQTKFNEIAEKFLRENQSLQAIDQSLDQKLNLKKFKFNNSNIHFFSPKVDGDQKNDNRKIHEKFHFRFNKDGVNQNYAHQVKDKIFRALKTARNNLGISDDDMIQFSILAVKHQGLGNVFSNLQNKQKIEADFQKIFGENWQEKKSQAIEFSANFQQFLEKENIITGRASNYREVGMRLKRLDPELLQEFLLKEAEMPLKKEFIKDNFLNKFNKIMNSSNVNLQDSIKSLYSAVSSR